MAGSDQAWRSAKGASQHRNEIGSKRLPQLSEVVKKDDIAWRHFRQRCAARQMQVRGNLVSATRVGFPRILSRPAAAPDFPSLLPRLADAFITLPEVRSFAKRGRGKYGRGHFAPADPVATNLPFCCSFPSSIQTAVKRGARRGDEHPKQELPRQFGKRSRSPNVSGKKAPALPTARCAIRTRVATVRSRKRLGIQATPWDQYPPGKSPQVVALGCRRMAERFTSLTPARRGLRFLAEPRPTSDELPSTLGRESSPHALSA